jgi:hypothetical protein
MSDNQYWRGLNRRFDRRVALLYRLGFRLASVDNMGYMVRAERRDCDRRGIPNLAIMYADNRAWLEMLHRVLRRSYIYRHLP